MAAEPVPFASLYQINIQANGTVSTNANLKITNSDAVSFHNGASFPVNIVFTSVFGPLTVPAGQTQSPNGGPGVNTTINYTIYNASTGAKTGGPYSIQIGTGPLVVNISSLNPTPDPIALPPGGQLKFVSDAKYNIAWSSNQMPVTAWTPQPLQLVAGTNPIMTALPAVINQVLTYTLTNATEIHGGGTVNVGS